MNEEEVKRIVDLTVTAVLVMARDHWEKHGTYIRPQDAPNVVFNVHVTIGSLIGITPPELPDESKD